MVEPVPVMLVNGCAGQPTNRFVVLYTAYSAPDSLVHDNWIVPAGPDCGAITITGDVTVPPP